MNQRFFFKKNERLTGYSAISELFEKGININTRIFRVTYIFTDQEKNYPVKVLFSVPKKNISKSYMRNRLKRKMREVYRMNKHNLYEILRSQTKKIHLAFVYILSEEVNSATIGDAIIETLRIIETRLNKT